MPAFAGKVTCGDGYTNAATIEGVWESAGGSFALSNANGDAIVQLQSGPVNQGQWGSEAYVPAGSSAPIYAGTTGIRFRNAVAGSPAVVVSCSIAGKREPALTVAAGPGSAPTPPAVSVVAIGNISLGQTSPLLLFSNIDQSYANLMLVGRVKTNASPGPTDMLRMQFNGDSGAHYYWEQSYASGTTPAATEGRADVAVSLFPATTQGGGATGRFSPFEIVIPWYNESGDFADGVCKWGSPVGTAAGSIYAGVTGFAWDQLEPITGIALFPTSGGLFVGGSRVTLYGMGST